MKRVGLTIGTLVVVVELSAATMMDLKAKAVWPTGLGKEMNTLIAFRTTFEAPKDGADVTFDMVAWYAYRVTLNGEFVAFGPARGPKGFFRPDILKLPIKAGRNELQVEVAGYNCRNFYLMKQPPFFKAQVRAGDCILASSGRDFKAFRLPRVQKVPRYSYQRTFSEAYVLPGREEGPLALAPAPEPKLIDRVAPEPEFEFRADLPPVAFSRVFVDDGFKVRDDRSLTFPGTRPDFDGFPKDTLDLNTAYLAQRLAYRDGRAATDAEKGWSAFEMSAGDSVRFDLGQNDTGFPGTTVTVAKPGRIVFTFDEILLRGEVHGCERYHYDCANIIVWDVTEPGEYRLDAFEPYVMRYLEIGVLSGEMRVARPHFRSYKNSTAKRASFRASDPALRKIFEAAKETMMQNAVDVFMDCPSRERAGWNCDAYFTAPAATLLTGSTALERAFEENQALPAAFEDIPKGMFPMCYPSDHTKDSYIPNWAMWFVLESEEYLRRSGDRATIDALRPKVEAFVEFLWGFRNSDGLLEKLPSWVFVEWSKANDFVQDVNYPSNMTWSQVLDAVARLYGRKDLAEEAERVREKVREQSWNGRFFRDHAVRGKDGKLVVKEADITETCQYYAFFSGVATKETHPRLWQTLLAEFGPARDAAKVHPEVFPSAPFIGDYLRLKILERENLGQQILDETKEYFLGMAEKTGTLWEHADTQASCNHGFASYAAVLLAHSVLGIERIDLQDKRLVLSKDVSAKLDWVEGVFPVGAGTIRVRREGTKYETDVPKGWTVETPKAEELSFTGYTNKNPLLYSCGEEMRFYVSLVDAADGNKPVKGQKLVWTRRGDDGVTTNGVAMSDEPLEIKTKTDRPGFVRITVNVLDETGKKVRDERENRDVCWDGGAGADVNRIEAWPMPGDFDAFWDRQVAELAKTPCAATLTELVPQTDKVYFAKFLVPMRGEEMPAQGLVAWPKDAKDGTMPLDVAVTGYGFGKTVFDERSALTGKGRICVSITRQGEDPWCEEAYYKNLQTNVCKNYCFRNTDKRPEDTDYFKMLMRDALALRWAKTLPQWNGRDIKTHGGSMGGYQAIGLAALDSEVSEVDAEVPWSADFAGAAKFKRMGGWTPEWTKALDYLALASLATRVTCPVTMSIGLGDYVCPPSGEMLLFNALKGRKSLKATQNRGHGGIPYGPEAPSYSFENKIAVLPDLPQEVSVAMGGRTCTTAKVCAVDRGMRYDKWHNDYKDAVVYKIFMKGKCKKTPGTNLSDALDIIRRIEKWTGGMHQIAYLVGWQFEGHDSKYPSWSEVGRTLEYPGTDTPLAALRQAMRDAKRHNADLSLHVNMDDAYTNAPDWQTYLDAGAICRAKDGQPAKYQVFDGEQSYQVNHIREWEAGLAQKRIRGLVEMIPELKDAKTIHIDAFFGTKDDFLGTSYKDDEKAMDKCIDLWHELGIDVTTELLFDMDHIGFFPTVYHNNMDERHRLQVRPEVLCGGDQEWCCRDMNWYCFGETWHARAPDGGCVYPEAWGESHWGDLSTDAMKDGRKFLKGLYTHSMLCRWYNGHAPVRHEVDAEYYKVHREHGVLCDVRIADRHLTVTENGRTVVDGGDMLLDFAEPDGAKLIAYSEKGCDRTFALPKAMSGVKKFSGVLLPEEQPLELVPQDGKVHVGLASGQGFCIFCPNK